MQEVKHKQAFLLLSNNPSDKIVSLYKDIQEATKGMGNAYFLFHSNIGIIPDKISKLNYFSFSNKDLFDLKYIPLEPKFMPISSHFPLFYFYLNHRNYSQYWLIEDDVRFNGDWFDFFSSFVNDQSDFISSHIKPFSENKQWDWWNSLRHSKINIPHESRIRSFNPVCRCSNKALHLLHNELRNGWIGHHEVLLPTLLKQKGLKLLDISGEGDYKNTDVNIKFCSDETMRFRPAFKQIGDEQNVLYHPIKESLV